MFTSVMNNYARELGILKEKDANFTGADIRNGMTAVVSIKHPRPDLKVRQKQSWIIRMLPEQQEKLQEMKLYYILTEMWKHSKASSPAPKKPQKFEK